MRNRFVFVSDVAAVAIAAFGAFVLRFDWWAVQYRSEFPVFIATALIVKPAIFFWFGLYRRYWRYATVQDLNSVVFACGFGGVLMSLFVGFMLF